MQVDLTNPWFHAIGAPIISVIIGIFANLLGLRDSDSAPKRNCLAVGTAIFLMMIGIIVADMREHVRNPSTIESCAGWIWVLFSMLFFSLVNDRFLSWEENDNGQYQKRAIIGIFIPTAIACIMMIVYQLDRFGVL